MQRCSKLHGSKGKDSAMKETQNVTMKNSCCGEIECAAITQEMKDMALLLDFHGVKRNIYLKVRGIANGSKQRLHTDKNDCSSPTRISINSETHAE